MKPLQYSSLGEFLYRFESFANSELNEIDIIAPTSIKLMVSAQDRQRSFDWIGINFLFEEVVEANLIESEKLKLIDMEDGLSIIFENGLFYFMLGNYKTANGTKDALCYVISKSLKYQETQAKL
ncbi:hypothetical protein MNB_SM-7-142 [hydrothermal vent metagenome]|uniref:Uncharacterized protein n=1 Tax=hydrothermal vent metagenome TaxID=652676 RepID=A0A1W1BCG2_9ZZZZ